jgi:hypothetical protein
MHLGLKETGPLCPNRLSWEPGHLTKAPDGPQVLTLNVLWLQKGAQMRLPNRGQSFTPTENVGRGLILRSTLPAQRAVCQPIRLRCLCRVLGPVRSPVNTPLIPYLGSQLSAVYRDLEKVRKLNK